MMEAAELQKLKVLGKNQGASCSVLFSYCLTCEWSLWKEVSPARHSFRKKRGSKKHYARGHIAVKV